MKKRLIHRIIYILIIISIITWTYASISIYNYGNKTELQKADAAIVLGAAVWGDKPSPVFEERIKHGIWLYKEGYVNKLIFTGGVGGEGELAEAIVGKNYALTEAIPEEDILIETESTITQENLYYSRLLADENELNSFIIVSDPLHMKRSMLMAKDYKIKAISSPTPTTRYRSWRSKIEFLSRETYYYIGYTIYRLFVD